MKSEVCAICNSENSFDSLYDKYKKFEQCIIEKILKRYDEKKDKISNQQNVLKK